jgi:acrylyl-CoA reductase (NADPH)
LSVRAIVVEASGAALSDRDPGPPGDGDLALEAAYSSLNYKDALAVAGRPGVLRSLPMVPGIDVVGRSADGRSVVVTGAGLGERRNGGLAERVLVPAAAAVDVPERFGEQRAAAIGTAGVTAALAVRALASTPDGPVLVTGAGGGVGGFAVALLASAGYEVHAATGRAGELGDHLRALGATEIVDRLPAEPGRPLQSARWAGVVDALGGAPLANALAQTVPGGVVAVCGLAASSDLPGSVLPFILRGVALLGIDSVGIDPARRADAWALLEQHLDPGLVDLMTDRVIGLAEVPAAADQVLAGAVRGRIVVDVRR